MAFSPSSVLLFVAVAGCSIRVPSKANAVPEVTRNDPSGSASREERGDEQGTEPCCVHSKAAHGLLTSILVTCPTWSDGIRSPIPGMSVAEGGLLADRAGDGVGTEPIRTADGCT